MGSPVSWGRPHGVLHFCIPLHQQWMDATTPGGMGLFQMIGVFAEFERSTIVRAPKVGIARAKA
jgi:DNA invertase Pin-like site-specific DNA recombinase